VPVPDCLSLIVVSLMVGEMNATRVTVQALARAQAAEAYAIVQVQTVIKLTQIRKMTDLLNNMLKNMPK